MAPALAVSVEQIAFLLSENYTNNLTKSVCVCVCVCMCVCVCVCDIHVTLLSEIRFNFSTAHGN